MQRFHDYLWESKCPDFTLKSSFIISPKILLAYRILALIASMAILVICTGGNISAMRYLTNWGVLFVACYFLCVCLCHFIYKNEEKVSLSNHFAFWKFTHFMCELGFALEVLIPLYYWVLLYPATTHHHIGDMFLKTILAHLVIPALIHIEVIFNKIKFYKRHPVIILVIGVMYAILNFTYTKITGKNIYANLTWNDEKTVFLLIGCVVTVCVGFYSMVWLSAFKFRKERSLSTSSALSLDMNIMM